MKNIIKNILKTKFFIVIIIILFSIIFIEFNTMIKFSNSIILDSITNNDYYLYYYLFPTYFNGQITIYSIVLSICVIILNIYVISNIVNYFFLENSVNYLTRIERNNYIKKVMIINGIFIIFIFSISLIIFNIIMFKYKIIINIDFKLLLPLIIKILILLLMAMGYLYVFIISDEIFYSTLFSLIIYFGSEIIINYFIKNITNLIIYEFLFIILLIILIILLYINITKKFKRRDV